MKHDASMMTTGPNQTGYDSDPMSVGTKVGIAVAAALGIGFVALLIVAALAPTTTVGSNATTSPSTTAAASQNKGAAVTVAVRAGEYYFKSAITTFKVGVPYHFVVHNVGAIPHEFMLVQPIAAGMMSMENMDAMAVGHIESSDLPAGQTATVDVTFTKPYPRGTLEMACHVGQHYEKGMRLPIVVAP
jgi:uncharacterized cupredoxin-like copper-binding protein